MQRRRATIGALLTTVLLAALGLAGGATSSQAAPGAGEMYLIQAVPGQQVSVTVDGQQRRAGVEVGGVVGPLSLAPGKHDLELSSKTWSVSSTITVRAGKAIDTVLHRPASTSGDPVVSTYRIPQQPTGPGKARVLLAHTATAPPADVRVDGKVVFTNVANGEFAVADLPAGGHRAALLPSGSDRGAFLGPLKVALPAQTVTLVYAVGSPRDNSMRVVSHVLSIGSDGTATPTRIETGSSAGLVHDVAIEPFGLP